MADRADAVRELEIIKAQHAGSHGGGRLRAAIFGMNDGLVTNASLVVGVAAAETTRQGIILAGVAGLVAGAFSMAAGEYISVRTQRELFESLIALEKRQLAEHPEAERHETEVIFRAKGLPRQDAERVAEHIMANPDVALDMMAREELGLNPDDLGSPWGVAISSFASFAAGAAVPLVPYIGLAGPAALGAALALVGLTLIVVGALTARLAGRPPALGGARSVAIGALATGVTYLVGRMVGAAVR